MTTVGMLVTIPLGILFAFLAGRGRVFFVPFIVLGVALLLGLGWEWVYHKLQMRRWERDWMPAFSMLGGIAEGVLLWTVLKLIGLNIPTWQFLLHYGIVWWSTFLFMLGPMRILFPHWRFLGGRVVGDY
jgi:hypothetical protein